MTGVGKIAIASAVGLCAAGLILMLTGTIWGAGLMGLGAIVGAIGVTMRDTAIKPGEKDT